jgi:hypothetical protein
MRATFVLRDSPVPTPQSDRLSAAKRSRFHNKRYRAKYGRQTWQLCRTAFAVICERAAKKARADGCKLRVYVEAGDKTADGYIRRYYSELRTKGMPFASGNMAKYAPLSAVELADTLYDLDFKSKSSPLDQIADLYLYPMAHAGYDTSYAPYVSLHENKKLIDDHLSAEEIPHLGIKYSCFERVEQAKTKKPAADWLLSSRLNGDLAG